MIDHAAYWSAVDEELARHPVAPEVNFSPMHQTDYATVYEVKLSSVGSYRIFGFLSVPVGTGPFPALYLTPRYGSVKQASVTWYFAPAECLVTARRAPA